MLSHAKNIKTWDVASAASLALVIGLILVLYVGVGVQSSYAQQAVKTFKIKVQLGKSVIARGDTQTIRYRVVDAMTGQPVSGVIARATVGYADHTTTRQFATTTDASGKALISWKIESDATPGTFAVTYAVDSAAYVAESFDNTFTVVAHQINDPASFDNTFSVVTRSSIITHS
jgi:hypothetical protein